MSEKIDASKPAKLNWWERIASAADVTWLIWRYGLDGAEQRLEEDLIEIRRELNRLEYKP